MSTPSAETYFTEELTSTYKVVGTLLKGCFRTLNDSTLEMVLALAFAMALGTENIHQVIQRLGVSKSAAYGGVKNVSPYLWRKLLQSHLYEVAIPLVQARLTTSDATRSRDGMVLTVDDTVIARIATELGYVWTWWSGQLKRVTDGQNVIALVLVLGDIMLPLDIRIVSKQGRGLKTKPEIYQEMLTAAYARFRAAGIDLNVFTTTGDAAYLSGLIAGVCQGTSPLDAAGTPTETPETTSTPASPDAQQEPSEDAPPSPITGIFGGKAHYRFEIGGVSHKAGHWKKTFKALLTAGWGTDGQPVYRTPATSPTFGAVTLLFYIPKGKTTVSYLIVIGRPLRSGEILHAYSFHHRIEEFWKLLKHTLHLGDMKLHGRAGAHACIGLKVIEYLILNTMKQRLRRLRRFRHVTIHQLVHLCPHFVECRQILAALFPDMIPRQYGLEEALCR
ncbi:MAG: transposase [Gammaproteobacteria bacterium]|nr:transposase [Gammaproteobacteria bacterium]